jgi:hypothetical protein
MYQQCATVCCIENRAMLVDCCFVQVIFMKGRIRMKRNQHSKRFYRILLSIFIAFFVFSMPVVVVAGWKASYVRTLRNTSEIKHIWQEELCSLQPYNMISPTDEEYVDEEALCLPPPSKRAIPFEVREPLRNGKNVPVKKRWLELPEKQTIYFQKTIDGKWALKVPDGTKLWKEFYLETEQGIELVERRLTLKTSLELATKAQLGPGGWYFVSAYNEPLGIKKVGNNGWLEIESDLPLDHKRVGQVWSRALPIQRRSGPLTVSFVGYSSSEYVFPGNSACHVCHGGASGGFVKDADDPTLAFGIHPDNLTVDSLQRLTSQGAIMIEKAAPETLNLKTLSLAKDVLHDKFWGLLRNNCLSCHNPDSLAAARTTAFVIDPQIQLDRRGLLKELSRARALRHIARLPLVTPSDPERSEIVLRMRGQDHRRRMPPIEGGVPKVDEEFLNIAERWIQESEAVDQN